MAWGWIMFWAVTSIPVIGLLVGLVWQRLEEDDPGYRNGRSTSENLWVLSLLAMLVVAPMWLGVALTRVLDWLS